MGGLLKVVAVSALLGLSQASLLRAEDSRKERPTVSMPGQTTLDVAGHLGIPVVITNPTYESVPVAVEFQIQQDSAFYSKPPPDVLYGDDVAFGSRSWGEIGNQPVTESNEIWGKTNGRITSINAMTDGELWTEFGTVYSGRDKWLEAFGYIDLGKSVRVVHMTADVVREASAIGKADFSASADGKTYQPIPSLQEVDFVKGLGRQEIDVPVPFEARFIRFRLHHDGQRVPYFRYPAEFHVYAGSNETTGQFPEVGAIIMSGRLTRSIGAHESKTVTLGDDRTLTTGAYFVVVRATFGDRAQLAYGHIFVMPPAMQRIGPGSRFGINVVDSSNVDALRRQGNGSIHIELNWPAISPSPGIYNFGNPTSGTEVSVDHTLRTYHDAGFTILPCLCVTPGYLLAPSPNNAPATAGSSPPTDLSRFGEFAFQTAARYGHTKQRSDNLLTNDQASGLGYSDTFELWNEPNTDNTGRTAWKGSLAGYYTLFRLGADAVKRADPDAKIANGGWSHAELPILETMRTFKYPDGKCPLDFTDVLSVHYFSFRVDPELATVYDISHHHEYLPYERTVEQDLQDMVAWRDRNKPNMPIWITEEGHDSMNVEERLQACWLVRGALTALAVGVDKVQIYQAKGVGAFQSGATGLLRDDNSLKPAWFTLATLMRQFDGIVGGARRLPTDESMRAYLWQRGDKFVVTAWALNGTQKFVMHLGRCTVTDAFGASRSMNIQESVNLTEFPIYITDFVESAAVMKLNETADLFAEEQRQETDREAGLRAYLFKFGRNPRTATIRIGNIRTFIPVAAADKYDDSKGYGFETGRLTDTSVPYYQNPLTDTGVKAPAGTRFTFKATPGHYSLKLCVRPPESPIVFTGLDGEDQIVKGSRSDLISSAALDVGQKPVTVKTSSTCELVWMDLCQTVPGNN